MDTSCFSEERSVAEACSFRISAHCKLRLRVDASLSLRVPLQATSCKGAQGVGSAELVSTHRRVRLGVDRSIAEDVCWLSVHAK